MPIGLRRLSVLDFNTPGNAVELAPLAERLGYHRYWLGEHHSPGQCANPLLLGIVLAGLTERIRIGSGGACLNYTNPWRLAEDARLVQHLFADRFDLGLARGLPYPPALTAALSEKLGGQAGETFAERAAAVHRYVTGRLPDGDAMAGTPPYLEAGPPVWILGTSPSAGRLAAQLGTGLCLSLHHAGDESPLRDAVAAYREGFAASPEFPAPEVVVVVSGICAESAGEAQAMAAALSGEYQGQITGLQNGTSFVGDAAHCAGHLAELAKTLGTEELMILDFVPHSWSKRRRMFELLAAAVRREPALAPAQ